LELNIERTNVVIANAASPSGAGFAGSQDDPLDSAI
jgi:hypothetical protein